MYVVTFYSFKGGTGRSMALVNVAAELLLRGRTVLLVDFDLEAPGLDTFPFSAKPFEQPGLVDMIDDYLRDDEVPNVEKYVYKTGIDGVTSGQLWLMPAGRQDPFYDLKFRRIDWQRFYEEENGFLFFEDIKAQWDCSFQPDYVLIDSRTGHTDIGGICTRQLPDCVVPMFFPNEQNWRGLRPVVEQIRREEEEPRRKHIHLPFVMANVPDLDDEDEILAEASARCKEALGYKELSATIHHFNSLSMLEQKLFVVERPRTKLAQEYRELVAAIVRTNVEDKDGAIAFLDETLSNLRPDKESALLVDLEDRLSLIKTKLPNDSDVIRRLARIRRAQRRMEESLNLYSDLLGANVQDAEILLAHAELSALLGRRNAALDDLSKLFSLPKVSSFNLGVAARLKVKLDSYDATDLTESPALMALGPFEIVAILEDLQGSRPSMRITASILRKWLTEHPESFGNVLPIQALTLSLIAVGDFKEAIDLLGKPSQVGGLAIQDIFNLGMAEWGLSGEPDVDLFQRVVDLNRGDLSGNANYAQCLCIANSVIGDREKAVAFFDRSLQLVKSAKVSTFSAWSYLKISADGFVDDLYEMKGLLDGLPAVPRFMRDAESKGERLLQ
jgi:MinD-like ATPase involved in chromosome partitioning or flagellar assembly